MNPFDPPKSAASKRRDQPLGDPMPTILAIIVIIGIIISQWLR